MPENVEVPVHQTSDVTVTATADIVGRTFVSIAGRTGGIGDTYEAATTAAGAQAFGVATQDIATGASATVIGTPGRIVTVTAGDTVSSGATVEVGTSGRVVDLDAGVPVGIALTGGNVNELIEVKLV